MTVKVLADTIIQLQKMINVMEQADPRLPTSWTAIEKLTGHHIDKLPICKASGRDCGVDCPAIEECMWLDVYSLGAKYEKVKKVLKIMQTKFVEKLKEHFKEEETCESQHGE